VLRRPFLSPVERLVLVRDGFYAVDPACRRRAEVLLSLDRGAALSEAARTARCSRSSIYRWLSHYLGERDPAALGDNRRRYAGRSRERRRVWTARAGALLALTAMRPDAGPGRLGLEAADRAALAGVAADPDAAPRDRYLAAMLRALDRGVPISTIARAAGCDRKTVYRAPRHHLRRLLPGAFRTPAPGA